MFTGLIREIGTLRRVTRGAQLSRLQLHAPQTAARLTAGDSLAVNGICLTVTAVRGDAVTVEAAVETLRITTLGGWRVGRRLHLEPALRANDALDGHLVLGHVDGVGHIARSERRGSSVLLTVACGERLAGWLMPKGSVAVDGVSLTVDEGPHHDRFTVNLIPHTLGWTVLDSYRAGQEVNLEMDVLVKAARTGRPAEMLAGLPGAGAGAPGEVTSLTSILNRGFGRKGRS
ncbi:MAG: riboflavin synthase [Candidatus Krumholzibacteriia bacterium]